jgi:hypothetical protein
MLLNGARPHMNQLDFPKSSVLQRMLRSKAVSPFIYRLYTGWK